MENNRFFIIDGYGQIYRSYYAFFSNPLLDTDGRNISAVYGFFNTLMSIMREHKPAYVAVALDSKGKTFRHNLYPEYKANRQKTPEDLHEQIPRITRILEDMGIKTFMREGAEADDVIATLSATLSRRGIQSVIVTGDKDLLQLVGPSAYALRPPKKGEKTWRLCGEEDVKELFGVRPDQICDYLTILGDASDNVPGIAGIGEKGAVKLLSEFDTLDKVYAGIEDIKGSVRAKLEAAKDHIALSRTLITLKSDLFTIDEDEIEVCSTLNIDWYGAIEAFHALNSKSLVSTAKGFITGDFKTHPSRPVEVKYKEKKVSGEVPEDFSVDFEDPQRLVGYGLKERLKSDSSELFHESVSLAKPYFDIKIAGYLLDPETSEPSLDDICLKNNVDTNLSVEEKQRHLVYILSRRLEEEGLDRIFHTLEMPLVPILARMEETGILLDKESLREYSSELGTKLDEIKEDIYRIAGHEFNIASPKQLQDVLFTERHLLPVKKTKSGYSTDSDTLQQLSFSSEDPVPPLILRYRALSKLQSTYVQPLPGLVGEDGRVHTTFLQTGTATGRLSSKNPNLQNIPVRTDEGRRIRSAFVASPGSVLLSADYAQIELAVLASLSADKVLSEAFMNAVDVHRNTAARLFGKKAEDVSDSERRIAKTINFGVIYGMSAFRLSGELRIPRREAQEYIDAYFATHSGVARFIEKVKEDALKTGEVRTVMGHARKVPGIGSANKTVRSAAERMAVNSVIQGSAAEIVKKSMISLSNALEMGSYKAKILLQVHDEVILEVPDAELDAVKSLVKERMESVDLISLPLRVSIETGKTWGEL